MEKSDISRTAKRLRWAMWIIWGLILVIYIVGRLGLDLGSVTVISRTDAGLGKASMGFADAVVLLITIALYRLSRMLRAIIAGDLFSARAVGAFRSFAFWLLVLSLVSILLPAAYFLFARPDPHRYEFRLQLSDLLTVGITLILFLVARLLERARAIDEEMREIV